MQRVCSCCRDLVVVVLLLVVVWRSVEAQSGGNVTDLCHAAQLPWDSCSTVGIALGLLLGRGEDVKDVLVTPTRGLYC